MPDIKSTENEFRGVVSNWLYEFIENGNYPFEIATTDPSIKVSEKRSKFPDIQIWENRVAGIGFCGWELKTPETSADDPDLLENAAEKARAMNAHHFVTWNMRESILWRTPPVGENVTNKYRMPKYEIIHSINSVEDWLIESKKELLKARAKELLDDCAQLKKEGHLNLVDTDATFFTDALRKSVEKLAPLLKGSLVNKVGKDVKFREGLHSWRTKQGIEDFGDETFYDSVSRQIIYRILGKIIFYQSLIKFRADLPKMEISGLSPAAANRRLKEYFEKARQIDYQAVFEEDFTDQVELPELAVRTLDELLVDLNRFNFYSMPQDVVGAVFEKLIPYEERHSLGQYFTREDLVDFMLAFCVRSADDKILDPTCGTGTFLMRAYDKLKISGVKDHKQLLTRLWGVDIAHFPAELATINLFKQNLSDYNNFPRIIAEDFFKVKPTDTFKFPPPKQTADKDFMIEEKVPLFDAAVGNFPYIRQELIEKQIKGYKDQLAKVIIEDWIHDYPDGFDFGKGRHKKKIDKIDLKLSGQADIYAYLFFHTAKFVKESGRLGFLTSNSWLDVGFGYEMQKFFLNNFKIIAIVESRCEPWFEDASVNTIFTILERCSNPKQRENHNVKFVKVKKSLKELIPYDMKIDATNRWAHLARLVMGLENLGKDFLKLDKNKNEFVNTIKGIKTYEDDNFRTRVVKQGELVEDVQHTGKTVKWGKYLRVPQVYLEILEKCKGKLSSVSRIAEVTRGVTTNNVDFFYITNEDIKRWSIERKFLTGPVIFTPKEVPHISIDASRLKYYLFTCNQPKKKLVGTNALKYILWGESQRFNRSLTFKEKENWYAIKDIQTDPSSLFYARQDDTYRVIYNPKGYVVNDNLYKITPSRAKENRFLCAIMNSTVFYLGLEIGGRINLGDGALKLQTYEVSDTLALDPMHLSKTAMSKMLKAFDVLSSRSSKTIFEEVKMKDRQKLDSLILEALGLEPKKYLKPIYDGLCELVKERLELAKTRKKVKQQKVEKDVEKVKESIVEEILPDGPKKFPEQFVDSKYFKNAKEISVPNTPLKLGHYFMGRQQVVSDGNEIYDAEFVEEAKFIIYSQKPNEYIIKIPKDRKIITKTVLGYERYLKKLRNKLFETASSRLLNHELADNLTNQIFEDFGMPII